MPDPADDLCHMASTLRRGCIVAAAGYGKTEEIAKAVARCSRPRLVLTHTHAGTDAILKRLVHLKVPPALYRVDTIAGWCLRFAASFPKRSELLASSPRSTSEWSSVYQATVRLLDTGAIDGILAESYGGVFVDEYQDCTKEQHSVVTALADRLSTCVFGDRLQSIFEFKGQQPVDWDVDVYPTFPKAGELEIPWRWKNAGNHALAEWLVHVRKALEDGTAVSVDGAPVCVHWIPLPPSEKDGRAAIRTACMAALNATGDSERLVVISDGTNPDRRAGLAKNLAKQHFTTIEAVNCKDLHDKAHEIDEASGRAKFDRVVSFAAGCMTGSEKAEFIRAVESRLGGGKKGLKKFGPEVLTAAEELIRTGADASALEVIERLRRRGETYVFRRERLHKLCSALQARVAGRAASLVDGVWQAQNRMSHAGRRVSKYSVGSTLLVKGLQFERTVITDPGNLKRNDWYVALTRATNAVWVVSPQKQLVGGAAEH